jgi:hypothetical protein
MKKQGQEEMVGFVLIMVVVAVIFLIFLGIFIRKGPSDSISDSQELSIFLDSALEYTTNCEISGDRKSVSDLIRECHNNEGNSCNNGDNVCEHLTQELSNIVEASWDFSFESSKIGYYLSIFEPRSNENINEFPIDSALCDRINIRKVDKLISSTSGPIRIELTICLPKVDP